MLRLVVLLVLLGAAAVLFIWNHNVDPRFYRFLESRFGHGLATVMGWTTPVDLTPLDIPDADYTEEERQVRQGLEERVSLERPTHELILTTGETMRGRIVGDTATTVTFKEEFRKFLDGYQIDYDERYVWD